MEIPRSWASSDNSPAKTKLWVPMAMLIAARAKTARGIAVLKVDTVYLSAVSCLIGFAQGRSAMSGSTNEVSPPGRSSPTVRSDNWRAKYGPWAVVTGASDGIGRAVAVGLAEAGLNLVLVARRRNELDVLAAELAQTHHIETRIVAIDLGQSVAVDAIVSSTEDIETGLLAAIAGFGTSGLFTDNPVGQELEMVDVNCRAVVELSHHFGRRFAAQRRGGVILMSSLLAFQGVPRAATYAATKAFIQTFAEGLRLELSGS
ncbi:MAG: SDR family NAD(P)-dependent oxidoreductase, partial [Bradyrhizobium sp.]